MDLYGRLTKQSFIELLHGRSRVTLAQLPFQPAADFLEIDVLGGDYAVELEDVLYSTRRWGSSSGVTFGQPWLRSFRRVLLMSSHFFAKSRPRFLRALWKRS